MSNAQQDEDVTLPASFRSLSKQTQLSLRKYLKFSHHQLLLSKKQLHVDLEQFQSSQLPHLHDRSIQYTNDEMSDVLSNLNQHFLEQFQNELKQQQMLQLELLRQLFVEAETQNVCLDLDLAKIEDEQLLQDISSLDKIVNERPKLKKLTPLGKSSLDTQEQIESLKTQNKNIRKKLKRTEDQLDSTRQEMAQIKAQFEGQVADVNSEASQSHDKMHAELQAMRKQLRDSQKELTKKVQATQQFQNIQQMLRSKNDQLRDLRKQLAKYEDGGATADQDEE